MPVYKGLQLDCGYRIDLVIDDGVLVELKAVERLRPIHLAQVVTYLRPSGIQVGLLVTFNVCTLRDGLRRLWLGRSPSFSPPLPVHPYDAGA